MTEQLELKLDPNGVAAPAYRAVAFTSRLVAACLAAFENDELAEPILQAGPVAYQFSDLGMDLAERRKAYADWIIAKGFQDLARGIRQTLEEALLYIQIARMESGLTTIAKVEADIAQARNRAGKLNFGQLLAAVNEGLNESMAFEAEFWGLQGVRNCLEHRHGVVGPKDIDPDTGRLSLEIPRLKVFYLRGGEEVEIAVGEVIDTHEVDKPEDPNEGVPIFLRRVTRSREYDLGEPIIITPPEFYEIAMACHMFANDLASKLPLLPPLPSDVTSQPPP